MELKMTMALTAHESTLKDTKFWDKIAAKYAKSKISDQAGYEKTLNRVGEFLWPEAQVIELGCGTGSSAMKLASQVAAYSATDLSPGMIEIAEQKSRQEPIPGLQFQTATAETLVGEEQEYDAVLGFNYLHLVPDLEETLGSIHALLKPGGLFISKTPCLGNMNPLIRMAIPLMRLFRIAPNTVLTFTTNELADAVEKSGFEIEVNEFHGTKGKDTRPFIVARRI